MTVRFQVTNYVSKFMELWNLGYDSELVITTVNGHLSINIQQSLLPRGYESHRYRQEEYHHHHPTPPHREAPRVRRRHQGDRQHHLPREQPARRRRREKRAQDRAMAGDAAAIKAVISSNNVVVTPTKVAVEVTLPYDEHEHHHEEAVILPPNGSLFPPIQSAVEVDQKHDPPSYLQPVEQVGKHCHPPLLPPAEQALVQHEHPSEYLPPLQHLSAPQPTGDVQHPHPPVLHTTGQVAAASLAPPLAQEVPKTAAKAAEFVTVADPLKCVNNPRPVFDELPLLPLPTLSWPGHYLPEDLHSPSMAPDLSHAKTGTFPRDGDGGEASRQAGHIHHQAVGPDELPPSQEHTPQPLELSQGSGTPELTWIWETEGKKKRGGRKKKGRS